MRSPSSWKEGLGSRSEVTAAAARPARVPPRLFAVLVLAVLSLSSCTRVSRWLLVGTWVMVGGTETIEFRSDGSLRTTTPQGTFDGRWELLGSGSMRVTVKVAASETPPKEAAEAKGARPRGGKTTAKAETAGGKPVEPVAVRFKVNLRTLVVTWPNGAQSSYYLPR